jgi:hypothetical protein
MGRSSILILLQLLKLLDENIGDIMNPESIHELINIVNCGIRLRYPTEIRYRDVKPHWWSWKTVRESYEHTPDPEYYHLDDSLKAIEALGGSDNPEALEFLERIYTPEIKYQSERYFVSGGSEPRDDDWKYLVTTSVVYPNARGDLQDALHFIVNTSDYYEDDDNDEELAEDDYSGKLERGELSPPENEPAHIALQTAIAELKKTLAV